MCLLVQVFKVKLIKISRFAWKMSSTLQFQRLPFKLFSLLIFLSFNTAFPYDIIPRLDPLRGRVRRLPETSGASMSDDFQTFYYTQTLDHFNYRPESYTTFKQRYLINFKYWGGANVSAPIFAYLGAEAPIDNDLASIGFLTENAAQFGALVVFIEVYDTQKLASLFSLLDIFFVNCFNKCQTQYTITLKNYWVLLMDLPSFFWYM